MSVVGGGPAGLMAAERLATFGARVTVHERMPSVGRKLLVAGRGGLNLTHDEPLDQFLDRYGPARARLERAVRAFGPDHLRAWCDGLGQPTFVGSSRRVFPESFRATALLAAWLERLEGLGVQIQVGRRWEGWAGDRLVFATDTGGRVEVHADATVLALGGASWPRTGSDGAWVPVVAGGGVTVQPLRPANCGFVVGWSGHFTSRFAGRPLKNVRLTGGGRSVRGEALLTDDGIEGTAVYALSAELRDAIDRDGSATLLVDLRPDVPEAELARRLGDRRPKESGSSWLRRAGGLRPVAVALLRECAGVRLPDDPAAMARLVTGCPVVLTAAQPIDRAISTAGGVALEEVDDAFMLRRRPGTFVVGEMLDWEAPTGGYLLQATFSTAVAAADGALRWLAGRAAGHAAPSYDPAVDAPETVTDAMAVLEADGYRGDFTLEGEAVRCHGGGHVGDRAQFEVERTYRFEGESDPGDEAIVLGVHCTSCGSRGIVVSAFGPDADPELVGLVRLLGS